MEYVEAVLNATSREMVDPEQGAVHMVLTGIGKGGNTADRGTPVGAILGKMRERMASGELIVVLKCEILVHAVLKGGYDAFILYLATEMKGMFELSGVWEGEGDGVGDFVVGYGEYLRRWLEMRKGCGWPVGGLDGGGVLKWWNNPGFKDLVQGLELVAGVVEGVLGMDIRHKSVEGLVVVRPVVLMLLHDMGVVGQVLDKAIERMVGMIFSEGGEMVDRAKVVYKRILDMWDMVSRELEEMRRMDERWTVPDVRVSEDVLKEIEKYIDGGCVHEKSGEANWTVRARRVIAGGSLEEGDLESLMRVRFVGDARERSSELGKVVDVLCEGVSGEDWRGVLKGIGVLMGLLRRGGKGMAIELERRAWLLEVGKLDDEVIGVERFEEFVKWSSEYLQSVAKMEQVLGRVKKVGEEVYEKVRRIGEEMESMIKVVDCIGNVCVDMEVQMSPISKLIFQWVVRDAGEVFSECTKRANGMVSVFFEVEEEYVAEYGLAVYEQFMEMKGRAEGGDGALERVKMVDATFRRPEEVTVTTSVVHDMRMFVASFGEDGGEDVRSDEGKEPDLD